MTTLTGAMDQHVLELLQATQSSSDGLRKDAESQLEQLYTNEAFAISLVSIAAQKPNLPSLRQSSLLVLKAFILKAWSPSLDDFGGRVLISDANKEQLRQALLAIVVNGDDDRKVSSAAAYAVSKIASVDFPEDWPSLLPTLLHAVPHSSEDQLRGLLMVLSELVEDGFDVEQFATSARELIACLYAVAVDHDKKLTHRALSVSIFRACFDTLDMMYDKNNAMLKNFMHEASDAWLPFFVDVLKLPLPGMPSDEDEHKGTTGFVEWRGVVALKIQVVKALDKIQSTFPQLLTAQSLHLFSSVWEALQVHLEPYHTLYINEDRQSRLEDADRLPYTLDFLILEEIDCLKGLLSAPPVRRELESQMAPHVTTNGAHEAAWIAHVMRILVGYSNITQEEQGMWEQDINVYLSEETAETANYSPRNACSGLVRKLCTWPNMPVVEYLFQFTQTVFDSGAYDWRAKEASFFTLKEVLEYFDSEDKVMNPDIAGAFLPYVRASMDDENEFLRARALIVASSLITTSGNGIKQLVHDFADRSIYAVNNDLSDIVKVSGIRALQGYLKALPPREARKFQVQTVAAISGYLQTLDLTELKENEDLLDTLVETLRDAIMADPSMCLEHPALDLLFTMAAQGASNFQTTMLVNEAFDSITSSMVGNGPEAYGRLCAKVLPTLTAALDVGDLTAQSNLVDMAITLLSSLAENGPEPLPLNFVSSTMPKLYRLLFSNADFGLHQSATITIKHMLARDHAQVFAWHDSETHKGGIEVILQIIDRLLGPDVDDNSATEVGGLAVELVEKAGPERLGPYLEQLLRIVAIRLSTAENATFIQNLVLVFARLSLTNPQEVVDFLSQIQLGSPAGGSGLEAVMTKWLENSVTFSGYDDIRQNVIALANIYKLHDQRLATIQAKGDLIVQNTSRIKTRSLAKLQPDQFAIIPVPLKLLKVLIAELPSATSPNGSSQAGLTNGSVNGGGISSGDEEWEDEPGTLDLAAPSTRAELMALADESQWNDRQWDDETQNYLGDFFRQIAIEPDFPMMYQSLNDVEREKLNQIGPKSQNV